MLIVFRNNDIDNVLEITFSTEDERFGESTTVDLKPNGRNIEVTNENKKEYIEYEKLFYQQTWSRLLTLIVSLLSGGFRKELTSSSRLL